LVLLLLISIPWQRVDANEKKDEEEGGGGGNTIQLDGGTESMSRTKLSEVAEDESSSFSDVDLPHMELGDEEAEQIAQFFQEGGLDLDDLTEEDLKDLLESEEGYEEEEAGKKEERRIHQATKESVDASTEDSAAVPVDIEQLDPKG